MQLVAAENEKRFMRLFLLTSDQSDYPSDWYVIKINVIEQ